MIVTIQTQEVVTVAAEQLIQYVFVKDAELIHVSGGTSIGHF
ncbi:MAG: hypothetical protein ACR2GP_05825 [Burkholderiaceae bacterium]